MMEGSSKLDHILMDCIQAIEEKGWTVEDCLYRYPDLRHDLKPMLEAAIRLRNIRSLVPSNRFQRETLSRLQLRLQASHRPPKSAIFQRGTHSEVTTLPKTRILPRKKTALQWVFPILVAAFTIVVVAGGFTSIANAAKPGDVLYQLDQTIEQVQIQLQPSVEKQTRLYLSFASERLDEIFDLIKEQKSDHVIIALQGYEQNIHAAETLLNENIIGKEEYQQLAVVLNETLEAQTIQLQELIVLAPSSDQALIQAAIVKISYIRIAMVILTPTATPTPQVIRTQVSPEPSGTPGPYMTKSARPSPIADGTPPASVTAITSATSIIATVTSPTSLASPPITASDTPNPIYPSDTPSYPPSHTPSPTPSYTPSPTPSPTPSHTPIPGPDLTISPYQWVPSVPEGSIEYLDFLLRNIGTVTVQAEYRTQLYVDGIALQGTDPEIGLREGRMLLPGETDIDYFIWRATCGVHKLSAVTDVDNTIAESNENNNRIEDFTITVDCGTTTPPQ